MSKDAWRPWPKASPELLTRYVNQEAAREAVPEDFFRLPSQDGSFQSIHDLREKGRLVEVVHALYDGLCRLEIEYDREPVSLDDPKDTDQQIRPPAKVVHGRGTCLDLALLFAGLCLEVRLLPMLVLVRNTKDRAAHALIVVDCKYTYDAWNDARGWKEEDREKGRLIGKEGGKSWNKEGGELWERIINGSYVAVECTGFAKTLADGRFHPTLSFDEACRKAEKNLGEMDHVATLDIVRLQKGRGYPPFEPPKTVDRPPERRRRRHLLDGVKVEIQDRLDQSLHKVVVINLLKEKQPQQVKRLWDVEVKISNQQSTPLPPETEIIEVFDQHKIAGKLLILGAPGAGKTTTLLQLARELVARAETDVREPMPVLFNLSSWKDDNQTLASWLVDELKLKYGVGKDIGNQWLEEHSLLPLLDALDELEPTRQEKCVQVINQFQQDHQPKHLVVCCRLAEYENCGTKLQLHGAIYLSPLTDEQIRNYLVRVECPELWQSIWADSKLMELARSPLLLSMITLAYNRLSTQEWQRLSSEQEGRQYLFNIYIEHMFSREMKSQGYTKEKTRHWLVWLAKRLREQAQTEFLMERLQPTWLQSLAQKWTYHVGVVLLVALIFVLSDGLKDGLMELVPTGKLIVKTEELIGNRLQTHVVNDIVSITIGLIAGLIVGLRQTIKPIETLKWSGTRAWSGMILGLRRWSLAGLKYGAYVGLIAGQIGWPIFYLSLTPGVSTELDVWNRVGQVAGAIAGLLAGVTALLSARPSVWLTGGLRDQLEARLPDALISGLIFGLSIGLSFGLGSGLGTGLFMGILAGLSMGIIAGVSQRLSDRSVFSVAGALSVGFIGGLISGVITWLTGGLLLKVLGVKLFVWMDLWLYSWLGVAVTAGLVAGLIVRLRKNAKPVETVQEAQIDVWNWLVLRWRQWLIVGVVAALSSSLIVGLLMGLGKIQIVQATLLVTSRLGLGLITMLAGSLLVALGGTAMGALTGVLLGALLGGLSGGLTDPDIERRTVPNQGIRQSAVNVGVFAVIGGLALGTIWGLLNLSVAVLMTDLVPEPWDWLRAGLGSVLLLGLFSGLVPGAACIQHYTLRFILWCSGLAPWKYSCFLDYATERMFLQRVGGRYRFIHHLLRDHFAAMEPEHVKS